MSIQDMIAQLGQGMLTSVLIYALTLIGAVPLALPLALARGGKSKIARLLTGAYISFMRGTPLMLQLIAVYFGPWYLFRIRISDGYRFYAVIIAFVLNYAAYFAEIYRGGIESISKGQYEAGQVLGMTKPQIFFKVILLQVVKRIVPPMSNEVITLVKDTSLARVIAVAEIIMAADRFSARGIIWPLFYTGAFFLIFNGLLTVIFNKIEKKLDYFRG